MAGRKTKLVRVEPDFAEKLGWLAEFERAAAAKTGRKPRSSARILQDVAGKSVSAAFAKIEPWVRTMQAAMNAAEK